MADRDISQEITIPPGGFVDLATIAKNAESLPAIRDTLKAVGPAASIKALAAHVQLRPASSRKHSKRSFVDL